MDPVRELAAGAIRRQAMIATARVTDPAPTMSRGVKATIRRRENSGGGVADLTSELKRSSAMRRAMVWGDFLVFIFFVSLICFRMRLV